ncbi:MAG: hypothetical protein U0270_40705 [Labilithrix sp.]
MGRLASTFVVFGAVGFAAFATAVGCANSPVDDGAFPDVSTTVPTDAGSDASSGKVIPKKDGSTTPSGDDDDTTGDDDTTADDDDDFGGPTDGGMDSGVDAGPPPPPPVNEGDPCTTQDEIRKQACGMCGTHTTVCEKNARGQLRWSSFSPCEGEHGECVAGTTLQEECNNCGTRSITCSSACKWSPGTCSTATNTGCSPLTYDIVNAGCSGPNLGLYRVRQCSPTCGYEPYSQCSAPPTAIEVGRTVGAVSSTVAQLGGSITKLSTNSCPVTTLGTIATAYAYTQVHNPLPTDVTVIVYNSVAPGGKVFDTAIAVYAGDNAPTTLDARKACQKGSNIGNATFTGDTKFASLDATAKLVTIPGNGSITVYSTAENATDSGPVRVSVKTSAIAKP